MRVGVIGLGDISDVYLSNLKKYNGIELIACASRGLEKAQAKAKQFGIQKPYATAEEVIADKDVELILNLTPPAVHYQYNLKALTAGKHVYTEKPLAENYQQGRELLNLAREKGLLICCAPDTFLGGRLQTCRELVDSGRIGTVTGGGAYVVSHGHEWHHPNPDFFYQPGAGPLYDIGPYYMTALLSLLGPVKCCCAMANRAQDTRIIESQPRCGETIQVNVDTHITGTLEFVSGAVVTLTASFDVWDSELPRLELYGTKGTLLMRDIDPLDGPNLFGGETLMRDEKTYRWRAQPRQDSFTKVPWETVPNRHPFNETSHRENSRGLGLVDMVYAIKNHRPARASGEMALHSLEVMDGMMVSAREKRFYMLETTFERPAPLPLDFPDGE